MGRSAYQFFMWNTFQIRIDNENDRKENVLVQAVKRHYYTNIRDINIIKKVDRDT